MDKNIIFKGAATAVVTPFDSFGRPDLKELGRIIEFQILEGIDAIVVCGTTGEAPTLTDTEHQMIIDYAAGVIKGRVPLICGTGSNDTAHAIMMSKCAEANGANGLLLVTPYYNRATSEGLIKSYTAIADAVNIPAILYNVPSRTTVDIPMEVYRALAYHPNITGIKEASGSIPKFAHLYAELSQSYALYTGCDDNITATLCMGGSGVISVVSNIMPKYVHQMCQAAFEGDFKKCRDMQINICQLNSILFSEVNPIPVKSAMNMLGFNTGTPRLPLVEMTEDGKKRLRAEMKRLDII